MKQVNLQEVKRRSGEFGAIKRAVRKMLSDMDKGNVRSVSVLWVDKNGNTNHAGSFESRLEAMGAAEYQKASFYEA